MTVLLGSLQARGGGVAKSKPGSLRGGWGSAGGSGFSWHVGEEFAIRGGSWSLKFAFIYIYI